MDAGTAPVKDRGPLDDWLFEPQTQPPTAPAHPHRVDDGVPLGDLVKSVTSEWYGTTIDDGPFKFFDPQADMHMQGGVLAHPMDSDTSGIHFNTLRNMRGVFVIQSIIGVRQNQARRFCRVSPGRFQPGYRVVTRDPDQKVTEATQKR